MNRSTRMLSIGLVLALCAFGATWAGQEAADAGKSTEGGKAIKQIDEMIANAAVNKEEAIIVAREYIIKKEMNKILDISKPKVKKKGDNYQVIFKINKKLNPLGPLRHRKNRPYVVYVNRTTGEIELSHYW